MIYGIQLAEEEFVRGGRVLRKKVEKYAPRFLAVLGVGAYRVEFDSPKAVVGPQEETIGGTRLWVLPSPSGLNAHYQAKELARVFRALRKAAR